MSTEEKPWHAAFPAPKSVTDKISAKDVANAIETGDKTLLVVDVRRTDFEVLCSLRLV